MKISFNGNVFSANGQCIIGGGTGNTQKFDEVKAKDCSNIEKISINSALYDVNVSVSNSSKVEAHFYGEANIDGDVNFDVYVVNCELIITLKFTGNCSYGNLKLDVTIPQKIFKVISANSSSANITLNEGVLVNYLKAKTISGDLKTKATVNNASVSTMSGNIGFCTNATQDINVEISTMSGNVSVEFNNIGHINLSTNSMSGNVKNLHKERRGYNADVDISTMSGNISIK